MKNTKRIVYENVFSLFPPLMEFDLVNVQVNFFVSLVCFAVSFNVLIVL